MAINKLGSPMQAPITYTPTKYGSKDKQTKSGKTDTFVLTKEGQDYLARKNAEKTENSILQKDGFLKDKNNSFIEMQAYMKQLEESKKDKSSDRFQDLAKCMKIAARIMHGDKVPMKDMKFLAEKNPDMFRNAIMLKQHNPEPKKYKSVLDDDDENAENDSLVSAISDTAAVDDPTAVLAEGLDGLSV